MLEHGRIDLRSAPAGFARIGAGTAHKLFDDADPIGETVRIRGIPFTVTGRLGAKGSNMMGQDQDDIVIMPYTTAMRRVFGLTTLRLINVSAASPAISADVARQISELLRQRHRIQPGNDDDFMIRTQEEINAFATSTTKILTALPGAMRAPWLPLSLELDPDRN